MTSFDTIIIRAIRPAPGRIGRMQLTRLAYFDFSAHGFLVRGAVLLRTDRTGQPVAWMPRLSSPTDPAGDARRSLTVLLPDLGADIAAAAHRAYEAQFAQ